jgi:transcriptional regulator
MYLPKAFVEHDRTVALRLMTSDGFATVFTAGSEPQASHVPTLVEDGPSGLSIQFHLARANPQCKQLAEGAPCLVVYLGPHCYVSPSWYTEHPSVPTWNFLSVHAEGSVSIQNNQELEAQLAELTARHEPTVGGDWTLDSIPEQFKAQLLPQIRGFRVQVSRLEAKSKLSQNRLEVDRQRVMQKLLASSDPAAQAVGQWMATKFGQPAS